MAVAPTGNIFKALSFDNVSSRTYGVYITGEAVYNAPGRDVEMVEIPGRNGSFALDKGRFQNIEVSYPAGIFADSEADFAEAVSDFRNFLCSRNGYVRLTDEYNPNEYRMAIYKSGLEVSPAQLKAGEFNIVFDCKPQRWLTSGEDAVTMGVWGDTDTAEGAIATFTAEDGDGVKSLVADIVPIQSGTGAPSPNNVRPITGHTQAKVYVSPTTQQADATTYTVSFSSAGTVYGGTVDIVSGELTVTHKSIDLGDYNWDVSGNGNYYTMYNATISSEIKRPTSTSTMVGVKCSCYVENATDRLYDASVDYSIAVRSTNGNIWVRDTTNGTSGANLKTFLTGKTLVYELATPLTYTLTPTQVSLLIGTNNIWSDTGDVSVEYGRAPNMVVNPTLFKASPMLEATGYGTIGINSDQITVENQELGEIQIAPSVTTASSTLDVSNLNTGDAIYDLSDTAPHCFVLFTPTNTSSPLTISVTSIANGSATTSRQHYNVVLKIHPEISGFVKGTTAQVVTTVNLSYSYQGTTSSGIFTLTTAYNSSTNTITMGGTISGLPNGVGISRSYTHPKYYGYSTKSALPSPLYIDLDIGEAYGTINNQLLSLNNIVTMPAELPKLKSGANPITYDNTITALKVIPRWWKV